MAPQETLWLKTTRMLKFQLKSLRHNEVHQVFLTHSLQTVQVSQQAVSILELSCTPKSKN